MLEVRDQVHTTGNPPPEDASIATIRTEGMMVRAALDEATIADYAECMEAGDQFPPVRVYRDSDGLLWIADGFHRLEAARRIGRDTIPADIWVGSKQEALIAAIPCNIKHGLRRTNADKRKAITILLADESWCQKSDVVIAKYAAVSDRFVAGLRTELSSNRSMTGARVVERNGKTFTMQKKATSPAASRGRSSRVPAETIEQEALRCAAEASGIPQETITQVRAMQERRPDLYQRVRGNEIDLETALLEMTAERNEAFIADTVAKTGLNRDEIVRDLFIGQAFSEAAITKMDAAGLSSSEMLKIATAMPVAVQAGGGRKSIQVRLTWDFMSVAKQIAGHYTSGELCMLISRLKLLQADS